MKRNLQSLWLGIFHGLNDLSAAYWLGSYISNTALDTAQLFVLYNVLAFGGQFVLAGFMQGTTIRSVSFRIIGLLLILAWFIGDTNPYLTVVLLGLVSSAFHLLGGVYVLRLYSGSSAHVGLFSAPGVLGIAIGGICIAQPIGHLTMAFIIAGIILGLIFLLRLPDLPAIWSKTQVTSKFHFDRHDWAMLLLLLTVVLRSGIWNIVFTSWHYFEANPVWMAVAACCGKGLGGLLGIWVQPKKLVQILTLSLLITFVSAILFNNYISLLIGIFCLQALIPLTWVILENTYLKNPLLSTSLSLGILLLFGGFTMFPPFSSWFSSIYGIIASILMLIAFYFFAFNISQKTVED